MKKVLGIFTFCMSLIMLAAHAQTTPPPQVVVSIKPIHALVSGVMSGVNEPTLLLHGGESPHLYSLRPSEMRQLHQADLVIWVGDNLESFLVKPMQNIDGQVLSLLKTPNLILLKPRSGGYWTPHDSHHDEPHGHGHTHHLDEAHSSDAAWTGSLQQTESPLVHVELEHHHHHDHGSIDPHIWLSPRNAQYIVTYVADTLSQVSPAYANVFQANAASLQAQLQQLDAQLVTQLSPIKSDAYLVFHDAYQYFEQHYGLNSVGTVNIHPEQRPGARRLLELRQRLTSQPIKCVFSEPQFTAKWLNSITEDTAVRRGVLDPLGIELAVGEGAYLRLLQNLATALVACLSQS